MNLLLLVGALLAPQSEWDAALARRLEAAVERGLPKGAAAGIVVADLTDGRVLWEREPQRPLAPASNAKLFTTAAALWRLGKDFEFQTRVSVAGGALHVSGGGDPNLSGRFHDGDPTAVFKGWATRLKQAKIERVENIVLHDAWGAPPTVHPDWAQADPGAWWRAPVAAFSLNDNCVDVTLHPAAKAGLPATVALSPDTTFVRVVNKTVTVEKIERGQEAIAAVQAGAIVVSRQVGARGPPPSWSIAIDDPAMYFGTVLSETLQREGIAVTGKIVLTADPPPAGEPLIVTRSALAPALRVANARSQNLYAELLARHVAVAASRPATFEEAAAAVNAFAASVGAKETRLADGSGLSPHSRTTARDVVTLLVAMRRRPDWKIFDDSLAVSGQEGTTLRNRMRQPALAGRVHAKTGTIERVASLSGYVRTAGGSEIAFSILINGHRDLAAAHRLMDSICEAIVEH
jgi:D-alanyl-D-alanine carboxypeptidase/D-alanyl-D-alanine-endopeptidase (penicillin-binding protein 4)